MKTLKYIYESILDDEDDLVDSVDAVAGFKAWMDEATKKAAHGHLTLNPSSHTELIDGKFYTRSWYRTEEPIPFDVAYMARLYVTDNYNEVAKTLPDYVRLFICDCDLPGGVAKGVHISSEEFGFKNNNFKQFKDCAIEYGNQNLPNGFGNIHTKMGKLCLNNTQIESWDAFNGLTIANKNKSINFEISISATPLAEYLMNKYLDGDEVSSTELDEEDSNALNKLCKPFKKCIVLLGYSEKLYCDLCLCKLSHGWVIDTLIKPYIRHYYQKMKTS